MRNRKPRTLSPDEVRAFLDSKPGWMMLSTVGKDGMPHTVPLGYFMVGDDLYLGTMEGTQKIRNIERNPRVSVLVERSEGSHLLGVMIQGEARVVSDDAERLALQREAARGRGTPEAELPTAPRPGGAYIQVMPRKVLSWEYGGPA